MFSWSPNNIVIAANSHNFTRKVVCVNRIIVVLADWFWAILDIMNRPGEFRLLLRSVDTFCRTYEVSFFLIYNNCCSLELISSIRCIYLQISVVSSGLVLGNTGYYESAW